MANAQKKLRLQHAHATNALNYGHIGTATYVEHSNDWAFLRGKTGGTTHGNIPNDIQENISAAFPFEYVGDAADFDRLHSIVDTADVDAHHTIFLKHKLFWHMPEVLPETIHHQQENAIPAQQIDFGVESALQPGQLAFGGAAAVSRKLESYQAVPIAAIVTGRNFEAIKILLIGKKSVEINDVYGNPTECQIPKIDCNEEGYWVGNGEAVQQVCFAAACDYETTQSAWMAARSRSQTVLFHPLFYKMQSTSENGVSRLSPNPILSIPSSRTGGHPHADVTFHPQDHRIIALVDIRGNWSVWRIDGRRSTAGRILFTVHLQSAGRLISDTIYVDLQNDWQRIFWVSRAPHEADRLLVSSHSDTAIFDLTGHNLGVLDLRARNFKNEEVVLDVAKSTTNPAHCYILTSTKLLLMSAAEDEWTDPTGQQQMAMILSWPHFRGRSDSSLRLTLVEIAHGKLPAISRLISKLTCTSNNNTDNFE